MIKKDAIYDIPTVCPFELNGEQVAQMLDLFSKPGWGLLMQMRKNESEASVAIGMDLNKPEEERQAARGMYHKQIADLCFAQMFQEAINAKDAEIVYQSIENEK